MDSSWSKGESSIQHISTRIREGDKASCTQLTFYVAAPSLSIQLHISNTYINAYVHIPTHAIPDNATLYALHLQCMLAVRLVLRLSPRTGQPFCLAYMHSHKWPHITTSTSPHFRSAHLHIAPICTTSICDLTITIRSINTHTHNTHMNAKSVLI